MFLKILLIFCNPYLILVRDKGSVLPVLSSTLPAILSSPDEVLANIPMFASRRNMFLCCIRVGSKFYPTGMQLFTGGRNNRWDSLPEWNKD